MVDRAYTEPVRWRDEKVKRVLVIAVIAVLAYLGFSFGLPVSDIQVITSSFGEFRGTGNRGPHFHLGIDLSTRMSSGIPIKAATSGWLVRIEIDDDDIYGNVVVLEHPEGFRTLYAHLSAFSEKLSSIVNSAQREFGKNRIILEFPAGEIEFQAGEVVGYSGQTGEAAQPHCHFEIRNKDETCCYDPVDYISVPRPDNAEFVVKGLMIESEKYAYREGETYPYTGEFPRIMINAVTAINRNVIGLREIKLYFDNALVYHISFEEIPLEEFNNVWSVYSRESVANGYQYSAWYKLYPDGSSKVIKENAFPEMGETPSRINVLIECIDQWQEVHPVQFVLERR